MSDEQVARGSVIIQQCRSYMTNWRCTICGRHYAREADAEFCYRLCALERRKQEEQG